MEIIFQSQKLKKECNDIRLLVKQYGDRQALRLRQRLDELRAANRLSDVSHLPPSRLHELIGDKAGVFSIDLIHPYRLLVVPANDPIPRKPDGGIDLTKVTIIMILRVEDTHG